MKLVNLLLLAVTLLPAASWDGIHGDITVTTVSYDLGPLLGLSWSVPSTQVQVRSTDPTVTAFRVTVRIKNAFGLPEERSSLVGVIPFPLVGGADFWGISESRIEKISVTKLRDGDTLPLN